MRNDGKLTGKWRTETSADAKGQWSQMPVMEWPLRRLEQYGATDAPDVKLAALIYVKIQVQRYRFRRNGQNLETDLTTFKDRFSNV